ncbi:MAG TPA: hypothetical protein VFW98_17060 [Gemmatimonadaceae bacterium]|nr:hypothetical protein [Gemmatimonadaceae bacterium]
MAMFLSARVTVAVSCSLSWFTATSIPYSSTRGFTITVRCGPCDHQLARAMLLDRTQHRAQRVRVRHPRDVIRRSPRVVGLDGHAPPPHARLQIERRERLRNRARDVLLVLRDGDAGHGAGTTLR